MRRERLRWVPNDRRVAICPVCPMYHVQLYPTTLIGPLKYLRVAPVLSPASAVSGVRLGHRAMANSLVTVMSS